MIKINLLPTKKKKSLVLPRPFIYGIIASILLLIIMVVVTFYLNKQIATMKTNVFAKEQRLKQLKAKLVEVQNYEKDNQEFREKTRIIEQLKKNQVIPLILLDEVSERLPKGVWLTQLEDEGGTVSIQGFAFTNSDLVSYVQNLKNSKYLSEVMLIESRQTDLEGFSIYKFNLTFKIKV
jgi:Tfp pilus assembly protein PilN